MWASEEKHRRADSLFAKAGGGRSSDNRVFTAFSASFFNELYSRAAERDARGQVLQLVSAANYLDEESRAFLKDAQQRVERQRSQVRGRVRF